MEANKHEMKVGMERYDSPQNPFRIVPGLMVHLKCQKMGGGSNINLGLVDRMEGEDYIKLSRTDSYDGENHWIPLSWVNKSDDNAIFLNVTEKEFYDGLLDQCPYKE